MNEKHQEFIKKYNELCEEYGVQIIPQMQLTITEMIKNSDKEEKTEEVAEDK